MFHAAEYLEQNLLNSEHLIGGQMSENELLNNLLSSNPNDPATNGVVLLLRAETKSEFKTMRLRFDKVESRLDKIENRLDKVEGRLDKIETQVTIIAQQVGIITMKLDTLIDRFDLLLNKP